MGSQGGRLAAVAVSDTQFYDFDTNQDDAERSLRHRACDRGCMALAISHYGPVALRGPARFLEASLAPREKAVETAQRLASTRLSVDLAQDLFQYIATDDTDDSDFFIIKLSRQQLDRQSSTTPKDLSYVPVLRVLHLLNVPDHRLLLLPSPLHPLAVDVFYDYMFHSAKIIRSPLMSIG